jgi:hypothetical protein
VGIRRKPPVLNPRFFEVARSADWHLCAPTCAGHVELGMPRHLVAAWLSRNPAPTGARPIAATGARHPH